MIAQKGKQLDVTLTKNKHKMHVENYKMLIKEI